MKRRQFLQQLAYGSIAYSCASSKGAAIQKQSTKLQGRLPCKIGIRQASLRNPQNASEGMIGNIDTLKVVRDIPDITGIELQIAGGRPNMRDLSVARKYKAETHRWGMNIPSTAGVWTHAIWGPNSGRDLLDSIGVTELLGARVMLVAFFRKNAPDMMDKQSYGPIVSLLRKVAPYAQEAGVVLGLENSLSPKDNRDLVDRIDHSCVKVYYDLDNMYHYGHGQDAAPGIELLGPARIAAVHVKNNGRILQDAWRIDWASAFQALTEISYDGWLVFESSHKSHRACKETTQQNIAFIKQHFRPPLG